MLSEKEYVNILDNVSSAVGVAKPIYDRHNKIVDFVIEYVNYSFQLLTRSMILPGMEFSGFLEMLSPDVDWAYMAQEVTGTNKTLEKSFYSTLFGCHLKLVMNSVMNSYIAITLTNISGYKDYEQQLKRQNLRLEALTEELNLSRSDLKNQLAHIKKLNQQLQDAAYHDSMTNLYNRNMFNSCLEDAIKRAKETDGKIGILIFDIDNMKNINDMQGHVAGDQVINTVARILKSYENNKTTSFRFSGDDFIVMMQNVQTEAEFVGFAAQLLGTLNEEGINVSGGISFYPDDTCEYEDLLRYADMAKTEVKKNGKNNISVFKSVMRDKFMRKMNLESKLAKAMSDDIFQLYFQPQFNSKSNQLRGFEALLRWHDNDLGWISPEQFIPIAEENQLVIPLGEWVLDKALGTLAEWEKAFNYDGIMSINVSPVQFRKGDFIDLLFEKISKFKVKPEHVEIEITEGILIDNVEETICKLQQIKNKGIGISLDDFGTGYSSLRYLQILPLTTLKIDKSFISSMKNDGGIETNITESIVNLVQKMGLNTIAEGVETQEQLEVLKNINCQTIQGFLKGKPMPQDTCEKVLGGDESAILKIEEN